MPQDSKSKGSSAAGLNDSCDDNNTTTGPKKHSQSINDRSMDEGGEQDRGAAGEPVSPSQKPGGARRSIVTNIKGTTMSNDSDEKVAG